MMGLGENLRDEPQIRGHAGKRPSTCHATSIGKPPKKLSFSSLSALGPPVPDNDRSQFLAVKSRHGVLGNVRLLI